MTTLIYTRFERSLSDFCCLDDCSRRAALTGTAPTMAPVGAYLFDGVEL